MGDPDAGRSRVGGGIIGIFRIAVPWLFTMCEETVRYSVSVYVFDYLVFVSVFVESEGEREHENKRTIEHETGGAWQSRELLMVLVVGTRITI